MKDADRRANIEFNRASLVQAEVRRLADEATAADAPLPETALFAGRKREWYVAHMADCLRMAVDLDRKSNPTEKIMKERAEQWGGGFAK